MAKRTATTDLNHENWNQEDEPEEPGIFQKANDQVLQQRVIKTAKRRAMNVCGSTGSKASPFSGFSGFGKSEAINAGSPFSFLSQNNFNLVEKTSKTDEDHSPAKPTKENETQNKSVSGTSAGSFHLKDSNSANILANVTDQNFKLHDNLNKCLGDALNKSKGIKDTDRKSQNLENLKELNFSCNSWITEHLEKNPYCILTPIFKDYEKHLAQLELEPELEKKETTFQLPLGNNIASESLKPFFSSKESNNATLNKEKNSNLTLDVIPTSQVLTKSSESGTFQVGGSQSSFQFPGIFQPAPGTTLNLNVGANKQKEGNDEEEEEESNEPPKSDFVPVVEENSIYDKRCKVFVKKDSKFMAKGVGTLFLKPVKNSKSTQLIVRADTSSGNILLNVLLTSDMPVQKTGKNNVMIMCIPTPEASPPPVPVLIRVKTSEDCDEVIKTLEKYKGS